MSHRTPRFPPRWRRNAERLARIKSERASRREADEEDDEESKPKKRRKTDDEEDDAEDGRG